MHFSCNLNKGMAMLALSIGMAFDLGISQQSGNQKEQINQGKLEERISKEPTKQNHLPDKYAVLLSGTDEGTFEENLARAYSVLTENGFDKENIYVLNTVIETDKYPADGKALKKSIGIVLEHLAKKIDDKDMLLLYYTAHGGMINIALEGEGKDIIKKQTSTLALAHGEVSAIELEEYLKDIKPKAGIFVFDQCYGGGFAELIGRRNDYIGISATSAEDFGYFYSGYPSFGGMFFRAWQYIQCSDANGDGRVSVKEAYDYARENDLAAKKGEQFPRMFYQIKEMNPAEVFLDEK